MSFSNDVKKELLDIKQKSSCCKKAFIFGASLCARQLDDGHLFMRITDDNTAHAIIGGVSHIFKKDVESNTVKRGFCNMTEISFNSPAISNFLQLCDTYEGEGCALDSYLKCDGCMSSFMRGVFCAAGSISDPHKSYTLEILLPTEKRAEMLKLKLEENGLTAGMVARKLG